MYSSKGQQELLWDSPLYSTPVPLRMVEPADYAFCMFFVLSENVGERTLVFVKHLLNIFQWLVHLIP